MVVINIDRPAHAARGHYRERGSAQWAEALAGELNLSRRLNRCAGSKDAAVFAYTTVRDGRATVVEIRGTMNFAPNLLLHKQPTTEGGEA